jgi:hypothetical protein
MSHSICADVMYIKAVSLHRVEARWGLPSLTTALSSYPANDRWGHEIYSWPHRSPYLVGLIFT